MPPPLDVDREQVRMLVLSVGVREAARQMGLGEAVVMQWSARGKWLAHLRQPPPQMPASMQPTVVSGVSTPADALTEVLADDSRQTRSSLSRGARKMAAKLEDAEPDRAGDLHQVAKTAALVHGWQQGGEVSVRISVYSRPDEAGPVIEV